MSKRTKIAPTLSALLHGNRIGEISGPSHPALRELRALLAVARASERWLGHVWPDGVPTHGASSECRDVDRALARLRRVSEGR